jgi:hypothetical protein
MRKQTIGLAAALLGGAMAVPALADVTVFADIEKHKTVTITEELNIRKDITVFVVMGTIIPPPAGSTNQPTIDPKDFKAAAEADAIVNVVNRDNEVGPDLNSPAVRNVTRTNLIFRSIAFNQGIVGVNQDTGDNTNQSNVVALAFTDFPDSLVNAQVAVDQLNTGNVSYHREAFPTVASDPTAFDANGVLLAPTLLPDSVFNTNVDMWDSVRFNIGIVGVNQNGGNNNNQTNAVAVAVGLDAGLALAETALGQENSNNLVEDTNTLKRDRIGGNTGSISDNTGIVSVNQSAGANNNQSGAVSIAASANAVGTLVALAGP